MKLLKFGLYILGGYLLANFLIGAFSAMKKTPTPVGGGGVPGTGDGLGNLARVPGSDPNS